MATVSARARRRCPPISSRSARWGSAGEVRKVSNLAARLREAERIGFRRAVVPAGSEGLDTIPSTMAGPRAVGNIEAAMACLDVTPHY